MIDREKNPNERRTPGLEPGSRSGVASYAARRSVKRSKSSFKRLIPLVIFAGFAVFIARQQIPMVDEWWQKNFAADEWKIRDTCKRAVLEDSANGKYVRIVKPGRLHETKDGPYIDGLRIVELGSSGSEHVVHYSCYLDTQGRMFELTRVSVTE